MGNQHSADWDAAQVAHDEELPDKVRKVASGAAAEMHKEQGSTPPPADGSTTRS